MANPRGITEITFEEERLLLNLPPEPELPKYSSSLINLANRFAQGTRPKVVGQMSELIKEFKKEFKKSGGTFEEWRQWYLQKHPEAIEEATQRIWKMLNNFRETLEQLTEEDVRKWVEDLVLVKTYEGLIFQEAILKKVAEELNGSYEPAKPKDESKGIDGFIIIGEERIPVSIKPETYLKQEKHLPEKLEGYLITYRKKKEGIVVGYSALLEVVKDKIRHDSPGK